MLHIQLSKTDCYSASKGGGEIIEQFTWPILINRIFRLRRPSSAVDSKRVKQLMNKDLILQPITAKQFNS